MSKDLLEHFALLAASEGGVAKLRELILSLAVRGKLVLQDPADEPASELLKRIRAEKERLVAEGKIKREKVLPSIDVEDTPYHLPNRWKWSKLGDVISAMGSGWSPACPEGPTTNDDEWGVLKTTSVQVMEYRAFEHKKLPLNLKARPEIEVRAGDILITRAGPKNRVGISCVAESTRPKLMISDKIVRFHLAGSSLNPNFVVLSLNAGWTKEKLEDSKTGMAESQVNISQSDLRDIPIPIAPSGEQSRIVAKVEALMALCDRLEAQQGDAARVQARWTQAALDQLAESGDADEFARNWQALAEHFDTLFANPASIDALDATLLQLAVRGQLVPQNPADEPASDLLKRIRDEKDRLIAEGKIKRDKPLAPIADDEKPFELPKGWEWVRFGDASINRDGERVPVSSMERESKAKIYDYYGASGVIDKIDGYLFDKTLLLIGEDGANLINRSTPIAFLATGKYWVNNHAHVIDTTDPQLMFYLQLFINAISLEPYVTGTAQPKMNQAKLISIVVALPPLPEQSRIVAKLDELLALTRTLRARLTDARAVQARLASALVDEVAA